MKTTRYLQRSPCSALASESLIKPNHPRGTTESGQRGFDQLMQAASSAVASTSEKLVNVTSSLVNEGYGDSVNIVDSAAQQLLQTQIETC